MLHARVRSRLSFIDVSLSLRVRKRFTRMRLRSLPLTEQETQCCRYNKLCKVSTPQLTSALHRFGWVFGGSVTNMKGGQIRHGRRIAVQATAAGKIRCGIDRGSARDIPGKPAGGSAALYNKENSRYILPTRHQSKGERPHSLNLSVIQGHQNAGKW